MSSAIDSIVSLLLDLMVRNGLRDRGICDEVERARIDGVEDCVGGGEQPVGCLEVLGDVVADCSLGGHLEGERAGEPHDVLPAGQAGEVAGELLFGGEGVLGAEGRVSAFGLVRVRGVGHVVELVLEDVFGGWDLADELSAVQDGREPLTVGGEGLQQAEAELRQVEDGDLGSGGEVPGEVDHMLLHEPLIRERRVEVVDHQDVQRAGVPGGPAIGEGVGRQRLGGVGGRGGDVGAALLEGVEDHRLVVLKQREVRLREAVHGVAPGVVDDDIHDRDGNAGADGEGVVLGAGVEQRDGDDREQSAVRSRLHGWGNHTCRGWPGACR